MMKIETREAAAAKVVQLVGRLDTNSTPQVEECLNGLLGEGAVKILIDFDEVDFVSSAGLRILLATTKKLSSRGGGLRIFGLNETVQEVFDMSGFSTLIGIFANEQEALVDF